MAHCGAEVVAIADPDLARAEARAGAFGMHNGPGSPRPRLHDRGDPSHS